MPVRGSGFPSAPGEEHDQRQDGLAPIPGWKGKNEWQFFLPLDELPQAYNPESGWLATANNLVVDGGYPDYLSSDLENPCRARRIADLLASQQTFTVDDFARFQQDTYSAQAERFVRHLLAVELQTEPERRVLGLLKQWDGRLQPDSIAASLYQVARLRALHLFFDPHLRRSGRPVHRPGPDADGRRQFIPWPQLCPAARPARHTRCRTMRGCAIRPAERCARLKRSWARRSARRWPCCSRSWVPDMARWQWGRLNKVHFSHPVGSVKPLNLIF